MERTWLRRERVRSARDAELVLDYYLLTEPDGLPARYGVQITMREGGREESAAAADVTSREGVMRGIIGRLADGTVTPAGLPDVLTDLLA